MKKTFRNKCFEKFLNIHVIAVARVLEASSDSSTGKIETQTQFLAKRSERGFWRASATTEKSFST